MSDSEINKRFLDISIDLVRANLKVSRELLGSMKTIEDLAEKSNDPKLKSESQKLSKCVEKLLIETENFSKKRTSLFKR